MIKINSNTKVKIISLLSAITLWMYVIAIVDPEDTRLIEDIPVTISNEEAIDNRNLVVYQEEPLTCNIYVTGSLSNVNGISKDDIQVKGEISNPIEGQNVMYLKANMSERVDHEFSSSTIIVNLEKKVTESRRLEVSIPDDYKENVETIILDKKTIDVSGPRAQVEKVKKVIGEIDPGEETKDYTEKIEVYPVNESGNVVSDVEVEDKDVEVDVKMFKTKTVPIKANLSEELDGSLYELSVPATSITGKSDFIDPIEEISTDMVDVQKLKESGKVRINLILPQNVFSEKGYVFVEYKGAKNNKKTLYVDKSDILIKNNDEHISVNDFNLPEKIKITIDGYENINDIQINDIKLFIDMSNEYLETGKYKIEYSVNNNVENVEIQPSIVKMKN